MSENDKIAEAILNLAIQRGVDKTVCPSEVARTLLSTNWRKAMPDVRAAAIKLQDEGKVVITQKGKIIDTNEIKGPIRIRIVK